MKFSYTFKIAQKALRAHLSRSLLTVVGIVIAISSIVLVMTMGDGVKALIVGELGGLGAETLVVRPGKEPDGPTDFAESFFSDSIGEREFEAIMIKSNAPDIEAGTPVVFATGVPKYNGESYNRATVLGHSAGFMVDTLGLETSEGTFFDERDIDSRARVVNIGTTVKEELFGESDAVGKFITIQNQKFRVVGVVKSKGRIVFFNVDDLVVMPYTTANAYLTGKDHYSQILVRATRPEVVHRAKHDIELTLKELHNIGPDEENDFSVQTQQGLVSQVEGILGAFVAFLTFAVAIALVVGGVGVMNVMLVSVTERTREVGLRKSLGATNSNIRTQFLTESVVLGLVGGVIGIAVGSGFAFFVSLMVRTFAGFDLGFSVPILGIVLGVIVSGLAGLVFGIYPAMQAAKKHPIEAMRYE